MNGSERTAFRSERQLIDFHHVIAGVYVCVFVCGKWKRKRANKNQIEYILQYFMGCSSSTSPSSSASNTVCKSHAVNSSEHSIERYESREGRDAAETNELFASFN